MALVTRVRVFVASALVLTGCTALIGVNDIYTDDTVKNDGGGSSGSSGSSGTQGDGGGGPGVDASCVGIDTTQDIKNCGSCGHDCLGGACNDSKCQAFELGSVSEAPLFNLAVSDQSVFFSTVISLTTQTGGLWRLSKTGGTPELYVNKRYAEAMTILGDTLYFVVDDDPGDAGTGGGGGFYSCPVVGAAPCTPTLLAAGTDPRGVTNDGTKVYFTNGTDFLSWDTTAKKATVFRAGFGFAYNTIVDDAGAFYTADFFQQDPNAAKVLQMFTDGGVTDIYAYESASNEDATLFRGPDFLLFTALDDDTSTSGVVRKIPHTNAAPCSYGGNKTKRPFGVTADQSRVYWTGLGDGTGANDTPYTGGTLNECDLATCCTDPDVLWTGDGEPSAVATDNDAVYFVMKVTGAVWKIAKP